MHHIRSRSFDALDDQTALQNLRDYFSSPVALLNSNENNAIKSRARSMHFREKYPRGREEALKEEARQCAKEAFLNACFRLEQDRLRPLKEAFADRVFPHIKASLQSGGDGQQPFVYDESGRAGIIKWGYRDFTTPFMMKVTVSKSVSMEEQLKGMSVVAIAFKFLKNEKPKKATVVDYFGRYADMETLLVSAARFEIPASSSREAPERSAPSPDVLIASPRGPGWDN